MEEEAKSKQACAEDALGHASRAEQVTFLDISISG